MTTIWKIKKIRRHTKSGLVKRVRLVCEAQEGDKIKKVVRGVRIQEDDATKDMTDEAVLDLAKETLGTEKVAEVESKLGERLSK